MNQNTTPTTSNLGSMIALLASNAFTDADITRLSNAAGFTEERTRELITHAEKLQQSINRGQPGFNLELSREAGDVYELTGNRAIWIGVEDPNNPGHGFDIRINDSGDGPIIDVWLKNDADIPGANKGFVPLDPIASHGYAYNDHITEEDPAAAAQNIINAAPPIRKYEVIIADRYTIYRTLEVQATNEQEAMRKAERQYEDTYDAEEVFTLFAHNESAGEYEAIEAHECAYNDHITDEEPQEAANA